MKFGGGPDNRAGNCMGDCTGTCETCALKRARATLAEAVRLLRMVRWEGHLTARVCPVCSVSVDDATDKHPDGDCPLAAFLALVDALLREEREANPLTWWYLSFADDSLPKGSQFLGVVIIQAHGLGDAASQAHMRGINPGGEVLGVDIPTDKVPPESYRNRLLSNAELLALWPESKTIAEHEAEERR